MWFLTDPIFWGIVAFCVIMHLWNERDNKRAIRDLIAAIDTEWNECINRHHKEIAEAYQRGEPVHIKMERR
jgi:hypothetical protein